MAQPLHECIRKIIKGCQHNGSPSYPGAHDTASSDPGLMPKWLTTQESLAEFLLSELGTNLLLAQPFLHILVFIFLSLIG